MGLLAVLVAQTLDPTRILAVAILLFMCRLAANRGAGWLALIVGSIVLSWFFSFAMLGQTGDFALNSASVGVASNAVIIAVLFSLLKLYRRFL